MTDDHCIALVAAQLLVANATERQKVDAVGRSAPVEKLDHKGAIIEASRMLKYIKGHQGPILRVPQTEDTGLNAVYGEWPDDDPIEDIEDSLKRMSDTYEDATKVLKRRMGLDCDIPSKRPEAQRPPGKPKKECLICKHSSNKNDVHLCGPKAQGRTPYGEMEEDKE